jgi:SAM-dependent methyltransferase
MAMDQVRFYDGSVYEQTMGKWSQLAGDVFLNWLSPPTGVRWIDIGCGNGAFTELLTERCSAKSVVGVDPSDGQLAYARARPRIGTAQFHQGDAMAIPLPDKSFDVAVMALVLFFLPDPTKGLAEMVRVVRPGGIVAAYSWDMLGGGWPFEPMRVEMSAFNVAPLPPASPSASKLDFMRNAWGEAGLEGVEMREITVQRTFADFDDFWASMAKAASVAPPLSAMAASDSELLKSRMRSRFPTDAAGGITYGARANAVKGRVPS